MRRSLKEGCRKVSATNFINMSVNNHGEHIMQTPISELPFSKEFIEHAEKMGFKTVQDILSNTWTELTRMNGFRYKWFNELTAFLKKHQLLHLLDK